MNQWMKNYLENDPNIVDDIKLFISELRTQGAPYKTIHTYVAAVKLFMADHGHYIREEIWKKISKRQLPPSIALTHDKAPTRKELTNILRYLDIKGRSIVYFLLSTGCRIGETSQLDVDDITFDHDPPLATIRGQTTKFGQSQRTIPFSYQARDAIKGWLAIRDDIKKTTGESFSGVRIWNISYSSFLDMWNRALKKAGLITKDRITGRKEIHIHSLRKWFFSNAALNELLKRAIMGQKRYLDSSYLRTDINRVSREYLSAMDSVSIYSATQTPSGLAQLKQMAKQLGVTQEQINAAVAKQFFTQDVEDEEGITETQEGGMDITELTEMLFPDIYEDTLRALIIGKNK